MKKALLKDSKSAIKSIQSKAGNAKRRKVSKTTRDKIEKAANIAQERIKHNNQIYASSAGHASKYILGE